MIENENVDLIVNNGFSKEQLLNRIYPLVKSKDTKGINELLDDVSSSTLSTILEDFELEEIRDLFLYGTDFQKLGDLFSYLPIEVRKYLLNNLNKKHLSMILSCVKDDDLVDFLEDITKSLKVKVLNSLPLKRRKNLVLLSRYSEDTIGSIMTTEYLSVSASSTIADVFKKIKEVGQSMETIRTIFVTDKTNHLLGIQSLEDMMFEDENLTIGETMTKNFPYISPIADRENAISVFKEYDLAVLPVVSKNNDMLGIITFDDVLDIIEEENTEDIYKQSAIALNNKSYAENKAFRIALSYVLWLVILLVINTFTSMIVNEFESALITLPVLLSFLPVLNDTGGNSGDQTTSTITRGLATGEITTRDYFKVLFKESIAGFLTAITVALVAFGWTMVELNTPILNVGNTLDGFIQSVHNNRQLAYVIISLVISSSLFFAVFASKILGATLPMLAKKCHIDPAIISGPLITSVMDILTLLIYFSLAKFIINQFDPGEIATLISLGRNLL